MWRLGIDSGGGAHGTALTEGQLGDDTSACLREVASTTRAKQTCCMIEKRIELSMTMMSEVKEQHVKKVLW
jgi:hypothetical protein